MRDLISCGKQTQYRRIDKLGLFLDFAKHEN